MTHKIFAWKEGSFWRGHHLVTLSQVQGLAKTLHGREVFATIQTYDELGTIVSCPLYFDIDGPLADATTAARQVVWTLVQRYGVLPYVFFSGNKGYHIVLPYAVHHPRCHDIVAEIIKEHFNHPLVDKKVYRPRAMFRLPGSVASKSGYYKIRLTHDELMYLPPDEIKKLATEPRIFWDNPPDMSKLSERDMEDDVKEATLRLPQMNVASLVQRTQDLDHDMTYCLRTLLTDGVSSGSRNQAVHVLARFFRQCDLPAEVAIDLLLENQSYKDAEVEERGVSKVVSSTYRNPNPQMISCKQGRRDHDLLKAHCDPLCHFNEDFPKVRWVQ